MGVNHLEELRAFLKKNKTKKFSRTNLRNELKQNYNTIIQNIQYLINVEKVVVGTSDENDKTFYQWK